MPGMAPGDDRAGIEFQDYVDALTGVLRRQVRPVVLVGHSSAGFILQAAARAPDKIKRLVLNAFVLPDGLCQFDSGAAGSCRGTRERQTLRPIRACR